MATRKTPPAPPPADEVEAVGHDLPEVDAVQSLMAELGEDQASQVTVYRIGPNREQTYVFKCAAAAFSLDELRDKYNGGTFRLYISRGGVLWKNRSVTVEPKAVGNVAEPAPSAVAELASVMREGFTAQANAMRELATRQAASAGESFMPKASDLPAIISAVAAAVQALRPPLPPPPPPPAPSSDPVALLLKGVELANALREGGGGDGEVSLLGIARDLIKSPMLAAAVQAAAAPQLPARPRPAALPPPRPPQPPQSFASETPPPPQPPATQEADPAMFDFALKHYLGVLCQKAAEGSDPTLYAEVILDNVPDDKLIEVLTQPDPVAFLAEKRPEVAQFRPWFEQLIAVVNQAFADEAPGDAQSGTDAAQSTTPIVPGGTAEG